MGYEYGIYQVKMGRLEGEVFLSHEECFGKIVRFEMFVCFFPNVFQQFI